MEEKFSLGFTAKFIPVKPVNEEMTLCKCYIMALGKNANKSNISKEACDDALPTLYNIPVVGHIVVDEDKQASMGGHDWELKKNPDGSYRVKTLTIPYGVVPRDNDVHYEKVDVDGVEYTYLVGNVILWTGRYPQLLDVKYNEEIYFNQSMEVKCIESEKLDGGYTDFKKFRFSALCLLGKSDDPEKNVTPCFPAARVEAYQFAYDEAETLFKEFQDKLTEMYEQQNFEKGGENVMDAERISSILAEFNLASVEEVGFEITTEMTEEELREKLADFQNESQENGEQQVEEAVEDTQEDAQEDGEENAQANFGLTYEEKRKSFNAELSNLFVNSEAEYKCYWLCDFDEQYVYVGYYTATSETTDEGYGRFKYSAEKDSITLDQTSFVKVFTKWLTQEEVDAIENKNNEYKALVEYKNAREEADKKNAYSKVLERFADLKEVDEYKTIAGNAMEFSNEGELEEKLFALRGRYGKFENKKPLDDVVIPVGNNKNSEDDSLETRFFSKFLPEALKK